MDLDNLDRCQCFHLGHRTPRYNLDISIQDCNDSGRSHYKPIHRESEDVFSNSKSLLPIK